MGSSRAAFCMLLSVLAGSCLATDAGGAAPATLAAQPGYQLQPGDLLEISVWKEQDLQRDTLIRPDGGITFPLAGDFDTTGKTAEDVRAVLVEHLKRYLPTPVVTVAVKAAAGNRIYVLGKVVHAGDFPMINSLDVMQAISLAGGTTPYAAVNDIVILRRQNGAQQAFRFHYSDVARGRDLSQNILLHSGDVVVVP
jgi:polysaccharide export outer membrane protein